MPPAPRTLTVTAVPGIPLVRPGDALGAIIIGAIEAARLEPQPRDVIVIAQKIVSKAEDRYVDLSEVEPSARAIELAAATDKDPRLVEVVLSESDEVAAHAPGLIIAVHRLGHVMANAGIDRSNIEPSDDDGRVLLLPEDPDATCEQLKTTLDRHFGVALGVVISDSVGRAFRHGTVGLALGAAGLPALEDLRGTPDLHRRALKVSLTGLADEVASAAALIIGEAAEGTPVALVRGLDWTGAPNPATTLIRPKEQDLFR